METTEQLRRIEEMEALLDASAAAARQLEAALEQFAAALPQMERLAAYYASEAWRQDYEDDESGLLPAGLKRGVLSQDGVYDLLTDRAALRERMQQLAEQLREYDDCAVS